MRTLRARSRLRFLTLSGITATLAALLVAGPAFAFVAKSTQTSIVPKFQKGTVNAKCPAGEHVAFGGMVAEYHHGAASLFPTGMRRTATGQWSVYGQSIAPARGSKLTAIAYCDSTGPSQVVEKTVSVPGHRVGSAVAQCPSGTVLVAGGFNTQGTPHFEAMKELVRIADDSWRATIVNVNAGSTIITAIAYCGPGPAPVLVSSTLAIAGNKGGTARATCPLGTELVFGGETVTAGVGKHLPNILPFSLTAESTTRWAVAAQDVDAVPGSVTALAYCR